MSEINCRVNKNENQNFSYSQSILAGVFGVILLMSFYWLILYFTTGDAKHPLEQFLLYKYWMSGLLLGFGAQAGLFWYIRLKQRFGTVLAKLGGPLALGGSTGAGAMVACCAHHLTDILPLLGLGAAALFLSKYQTYFFLVGIVANFSGILFMVYLLKRKTPISYECK